MNAPTVPEFKPSQVDLDGSFPPLCDTFRKTEAEVCAAWLVRTCALDGDAWRPLTFVEVRDRMRADMDSKVDPWGALVLNPFARPDPHRLVGDGFAEWIGEEETERQVQFTAAGFDALRKWVRS